jgi:hypothetical protein
MDELVIFPAQGYAAPAAEIADHLIKMIRGRSKPNPGSPRRVCREAAVVRRDRLPASYH